MTVAMRLNVCCRFIINKGSDCRLQFFFFFLQCFRICFALQMPFYKPEEWTVKILVDMELLLQPIKDVWFCPVCSCPGLILRFNKIRGNFSEKGVCLSCNKIPFQ